MKPVYKHYLLWEDYQNGMYSLNKPIDDDIMNGAILLSNTDTFFNVAYEMIQKWQISAINNLSNPQVNKQAWIGQAACCFKYGNNELTTRKSWALLSEVQKYNANLVADRIIKIYETENKKLHSGLGKQMLLQWDT